MQLFTDPVIPQDLGISMLKKELIVLGTIVYKSDAAVFIWHNQSNLLIQLNLSSKLDEKLCCIKVFRSKYWST